MISKRQLKRLSFQSSTSNDSNEINKSQNSVNQKIKNFDIEYPVFIRSHSVKKLNLNSSFTERIKEELNEDDSLNLNLSGRKNFNYKTIMPKDNLIFDKRKYEEKEPLNLSSRMEVVPEIIEDNFFFESPRITLLSDLKEDSELKNNKNKNFNKVPINENDIIKEENEDYFDIKYNFKGDTIIKKFENFIDKEEPPLDFKNLQGECRTFYNVDVIAEANNEEEVNVDAKDIIKQNSFNLRKLGNKVCTDEIDSHPKIRTIKSKIINSEEYVIHEDDNEFGDN
jgi:hypothetical protein